MGCQFENELKHMQKHIKLIFEGYISDLKILNGKGVDFSC